MRLRSGQGVRNTVRSAPPPADQPVSIACGDFNTFVSKLNPGILRGLHGRICHQDGVDYAIVYGGPGNSATVRACAADPKDRSYLMTEDMLGIAYGQAGRRHGAGPDATIPWPSNHPWLSAEFQVVANRKTYELGVATWNVLVRGASRKGFGSTDHHWSMDASQTLYQDIILELARRLAAPAPWDVVCLQEAGPGQIRAIAPDGSTYYYSVPGHRFTPSTLTAGIRAALEDGSLRGNQSLPSPSQFGIITLASARRGLPSGLAARNSWVVAREEHGRLLLVRASAIDLDALRKASCRARSGSWSQRFKRQAHTICLPLIWRSPSGRSSITLDTHVTNFHSDWSGVSGGYILGALGLPSARALAPPAVQAGPVRRSTKSSRARTRRSRRRRWGLTSDTPRWSTSSKRRTRSSSRTV